MIDPKGDTSGSKDELQKRRDLMSEEKEALVKTINQARPSSINHGIQFLQSQSLTKLRNIAIAIEVTIEDKVKVLESS